MDRVGNTVDVVEVPDDLNGIVDRHIAKSCGSHRDDVGLPHFGGRQRELLRITAKCEVSWRQFGVAPAAGDPCEECLVRSDTTAPLK